MSNLLKKTVKLNCNVTLPTESDNCTGCPANNNNHCDHLNVPLASKRSSMNPDTTIQTRDVNCPFNIPRCIICNAPLTPVDKDWSGWTLYHVCDDNPMVKIQVNGNDEAECITNFNNYILTIKRRFIQR